MAATLKNIDEKGKEIEIVKAATEEIEENVQRLEKTLAMKEAQRMEIKEKYLKTKQDR